MTRSTRRPIIRHNRFVPTGRDALIAVRPRSLGDHTRPISASCRMATSSCCTIPSPMPGPLAPQSGSVAQIGWQADLPCPRTDSSHGFSDGYAKRGDAVQDGDTDLELGHLTIEVPRHEAMTQQFHAVHFGFDAALSVIAAPSSPDCSAKAFRCAQGRVACNRSGGAGFRGLGVLAGRNNGCSTSGRDGVMALAGVERAVCGDAGDRLFARDMVGQPGQHGRVAHVTGGEFGRADLQCLRVNSDVDLAPRALSAICPRTMASAAFRAAVLARSSGKRSPGGCFLLLLTTVVGLSATFACRRSLPDGQRAAALQRFVIGGPVPGLAGGGVWVCSCHPATTLDSRDESLKGFVQQSPSNLTAACSDGHPNRKLQKGISCLPGGPNLWNRSFWGPIRGPKFTHSHIEDRGSTRRKPVASIP